MCLLDTVDGALMMVLYTSTTFAKDQIAILYYSIILTIITVAVAIVIGVIQILTMILNVAQPSGPFWEGVEIAGDHYDIIGDFHATNKTSRIDQCYRRSHMLLFLGVRGVERSPLQTLAPAD